MQFGCPSNRLACHNCSIYPKYARNEAIWEKDARQTRSAWRGAKCRRELGIYEPLARVMNSQNRLVSGMSRVCKAGRREHNLQLVFEQKICL